jgi:hypothetical protein
MMDEKKNKALWKLDKIEVKASPVRFTGKGGSPYSEVDLGGTISRKSY